MSKSEGKSGIIQFIKFSVVGASNTIVDGVILKILVITILPDSHTVAKAISFTIAAINSYIWNTIWTFKKEYKAKIGTNGTGEKATVFVKFFVVSLVGLGVNVMVFYYVSKNLNYKIFDRDLIPFIFASASAIVWNFFANKLWTYKR